MGASAVVDTTTVPGTTMSTCFVVSLETSQRHAVAERGQAGDKPSSRETARSRQLAFRDCRGAWERCKYCYNVCKLGPTGSRLNWRAGVPWHTENAQVFYFGILTKLPMLTFACVFDKPNAAVEDLCGSNGFRNLLHCVRASGR